VTVREGYNDWAATYDTDENRTRDRDADATRETLGALRPARAVEIGCGTGKNTALLARIAGQVIALDFSEGMLARARARLAGAENVTFARADIAAPPWPHCPDASADLVSGNLVLEHIADLTPVLAEAARVLVPGGRLFLCELHPARQYRGTVANFARADGEAVSLPAHVHHLTDFTRAAESAGLTLLALREWWHAADDPAGPPRLVSFLWGRG
jgi:Methylase involved in ubiquinone/menaquinone biosynthesis